MRRKRGEGREARGEWRDEESEFWREKVKDRGDEDGRTRPEATIW